MSPTPAILTIPGVAVSGLGDASQSLHSEDWELSQGSVTFSVTPQTTSGFQGLFSKDAKNYGAGGHFGIWLDGDEIYVRLQSTDSSYELRGGRIAPGETHQIGVSFGPEGMSLYVDESVVASNAYGGGLSGNREPIVLGASQWGSAAETANKLTHEFVGEIGELSLFDAQLDSAGFDAALAMPADNEAPFVFIPQTGQTVDEGQSASIDVQHLFRDPDGDALTYSLRGAPAFVTLEEQVVTIAPGFEDAGIYEVDVIASDGLLSSGPATITYEVIDTPPPPNPEPVETVQVFEAEDFDATQGVGVFTQGGNRQIGSTQDGEWVRYDGIDFGNDPAAQQTLTLRLSAGQQGGTLEVRSGTENGPLLATYTTGNTGGWASYDNVELDLGSLTGMQDLVFVFRGDANSIMDIDTFEISTVSSGVGNAAPVVSGLFDVLTRPENSAALYNLDAVFSDPDGDPLTYSILDAPGFVSLSGTFLEILPDDGDDGVYTVSVVANDPLVSSAPWTFELTVEDTVNPAPEPSTNVQSFEAEDFDATQGVGVFTQGGNRQIGSTQDGEWVRYDAIDFGSDPDAEQQIALTLSAGQTGGTVEIRTGAPDGLLLNSYTTGNTGGWASYDTVDLDLGSVVGVQDLYFVFAGSTRSIMDIDRFEISTSTAGSAPENTAPEPWRPFFSELNLNEETTIGYSIPAVFRDAEGDPLTYSIVEGPDFMFIDGTALRFAPQDGDDGTYTGSVVANDGSLTSAPWAFTINVRNTVSDTTENAGPVVESSNVVETVSEGEEIIIDVAPFFSDPDGDVLSYALENPTDFATLEGSELTIAPGFSDAGTYSLRLVANDGELNSPASNLIIQVSDAEPPQTSAVSLAATANSLTSDGNGSYRWDDTVTVTGYERSGELGEVVFNTQFSDHGFGVPGEGSRWDGQIDFYDVNGGESEAIVIEFDTAVSDLTLHVGMLGANEGAGETGAWRTFDASGNVVATGLIGSELSALGPDIKQPGSYGEYPIEIDSPAFWGLEVTATQFGHGTGTSQTRNYGENSSDFNIQGIDYTPIYDFQ